MTEPKTFNVVTVAEGDRLTLGVAIGILIAQKTCPSARYHIAIPEGSSLGDSLAAEIVTKYAESIYTIDAPSISIGGKLYRIENKINALRQFSLNEPAVFADSDLFFNRPIPVDYLFRNVPTAVPEMGLHAFPWEQIYRLSGLNYSYLPVATGNGQVGDPWLNAGLVFVRDPIQFGSIWRMMATLILGMVDVPEKDPYLDQISLIVAIAQLTPGRQVSYSSILPDTFNQHILPWVKDLSYIRNAHVIHHHNRYQQLQDVHPGIISWTADDYPDIRDLLKTAINS